jgi:effector-binding domain-containing protein
MKPTAPTPMPFQPPHLDHVPAIPIAAIRRQVAQAELPRVVPECCGKVWQHLKAQGIRGGRNVALYWDGTIRLEAGVECSVPFVEQGEVLRSAIPGGAVVSVAHFGPYSRLAAAHQAIRAWCETHGYQLAGPSWELYGHWEAAWDADPSLIRTDVVYQVTPRDDPPRPPA